MDIRLEIVMMPVSDVDRARDVYRALGWRLDADIAPQPDPDWSDWYARYVVDEPAGPGARS